MHVSVKDHPAGDRAARLQQVFGVLEPVPPTVRAPIRQARSVMGRHDHESVAHSWILKRLLERDELRVWDPATRSGELGVGAGAVHREKRDAIGREANLRPWTFTGVLGQIAF